MPNEKSNPFMPLALYKKVKDDAPLASPSYTARTGRACRFGAQAVVFGCQTPNTCSQEGEDREAFEMKAFRPSAVVNS